SDPLGRHPHAGAVQRASQDEIDRLAVGERDRCAGGTHEHTPCRTSPVTTKIRGECRADVAGERQAIMEVALASHEDLPGTPVDVIEAESNDLRRSQSQSRLEEKDGVIAAPDPGTEVTALYEPLDVVRRQVARQSCIAPAPRREY